MSFITTLENMKNDANSHLIEAIQDGYTLLEGEYYNSTIDDVAKKSSNEYVGKNVKWYGDHEKMIVIHKDYVDDLWGNIFDQDKIDSLVNMINESEDYIEIECSYGFGDVVDLSEIAEHQEAENSGRFGTDYDGHSKPYSLGDDDLDMYLTEDGVEGVLEYISSIYESEIVDVLNEIKYSISDGGNPEEVFKKALHKLITVSDLDINDEDDAEDITELKDDFAESFKEFIETETELKNAIDSKSGDLGDFRVQLRDGHHRVHAAIESGEEYICLNLVKSGGELDYDLGDYNYVNTVTKRYQ
jgi:hypothetical protein